VVTKAIEKAQKRVEAHNFDIRKQLLDYDNVMTSSARSSISLRREVMVPRRPRT
jgi:preprotein translocase subunit SecA